MEISASGRSLPPPRLTLDRSGDLPGEPHRVMLGGGRGAMAGQRESASLDKIRPIHLLRLICEVQGRK